MGYIPPLGSTIDLEFSESYSPPAGGGVVLAFEGEAPPVVYTQLRAMCSAIYDLLDPVRINVMLEQPYHLTTSVVSTLSQVYGLRLLQAVLQYYGDVKAIHQILDQYYGSAALLRRRCEYPYGDTLPLRAVLDQEWNLPEALRTAMEQRYSVSFGQLLAMAEQAYHLIHYNVLRQQLEQIYIMGAGSPLVQRPQITVTADGVAIHPTHINIEVDEAEYAIRGEIHLVDQAEFLRCRHLATELIICIDGDEYHLLVETPRRSRSGPADTAYIVPASSRSILLDAPYTATVSREFAGSMASAIVAEMAALAGIAVDWQLVDWYLPGGTIYANNETPMAVIGKIVSAVGGIRQTTPAGVLVCRPEYPLSIPSWSTAPPDVYLTDQDNFFSVDSSPEIRDGYNRFLVSDQDAAQAGLTLEAKDIDNFTKEIRVYQVPWDASSVIILRTSGGEWVSIVSEGVMTEQLTELVEIVGGEGNTAKSLQILVSHQYQQATLGAVTTAEDGHVRTEIEGNSLLSCTYITRYWQFVVSDARIEDVQFFPEEMTA